MTTVAALDVGGTTIKLALVDERGDVSRFSRVPTPTGDPSGESLVDAIVAGVASLRQGRRLGAVGVGLPGIVDLATGDVVLSTNLGWNDRPLGAMLRARIDLPVAITHDIRAGALAEARAGALGDSSGVSLFAAVGTGVSVALVRGREVIAGDPWQGEIGQLRVRDPFAPDKTPALRPLEGFASAQGIARQAGVADGEAALRAMRAGDPRAVRAWRLGIDALGEALAAAAVSFGATRLAVGGGIAQAGADFFVPLRTAVANRVPLDRPVHVVAAHFGDSAGCVGAGLAALDLLRDETRS